MKSLLVLSMALFLAGCSTVNHITATAQILTYRKDPNAEKLVPPCACLPAVAYGKDGGSLYSWDLDKQVWK